MDMKIWKYFAPPLSWESKSFQKAANKQVAKSFGGFLKNVFINSIFEIDQGFCQISK